MSRNQYTAKYTTLNGVLMADGEVLSDRQACNDLTILQCRYKKAIRD